MRISLPSLSRGAAVVLAMLPFSAGWYAVAAPAAQERTQVPTIQRPPGRLTADSVTLGVDFTVTLVETGNPRITLPEVRLVATLEQGASAPRFATTNDAGEAVFRGLAPGRYLITPHKERDDELTVRPTGTDTAYAFAGRTFSVRALSTSSARLELPPIFNPVPVRVLRADLSPLGFAVRVEARPDGRGGALVMADTDEAGDVVLRLKCCHDYSLAVPLDGYRTLPESHGVRIALGRQQPRLIFTARELPVMPRVTQMSWVAAVRRLDGRGLVAIASTYVDEDSALCRRRAVGTVVHQNPQAGQPLPHDTRVGLSICVSYLTPDRPDLDRSELRGLPQRGGVIPVP